MAKPFEFDVPIATERTIESVANVIKTNYSTKDEVKSAVQDIESIKTQLQGVEITLSGLNSRIEQVV